MILILCREETNDTLCLSAELINRGHKTITLTPQKININFSQGKISFHLGNQLLNLKCVLGWVSLHQRAIGLPLLETIEFAGIPVINNSTTLRIGGNKFLSSCLLTKANIPHIKTEIVCGSEGIKSALKKIGFPLVLKPVIGAKGQDVTLINSIENFYTLSKNNFSQSYPLYLQSVINKPDRDIRVTVIDFKAHSAFYRTLGEGGFVTNLSRGGSWLPCDLDRETASLAEKAAVAINAPIAGVDLIEDIDTNQLRVIEVNVTPSLTNPFPSVIQPVSDLFNQYL